MTTKATWITNTEALDYNSGSDSRINYILTALLSARPEYNSRSNKSIVLPVDANLAVSFSCNCCQTLVGCRFELQSVSFTFWVSYSSGSISSVQEDASGGSVTYNIYSSSGTVLASNITQNLSWGSWTIASDKSYAETELVLQGQSSSGNENGEARCWLRYYIPDTGLSSYSPSLSDFDFSDQLSGTTTTSLGLTPFVYYKLENNIYHPLCEADSEPCLTELIGLSTQVSYALDSSSSTYVPSVVSQEMGLYRTKFTDGTVSSIWGKVLDSNTVTTDGNNSFVATIDFAFNSYYVTYILRFIPAQEITSAISGSLIELVENGTLEMSAYPLYQNNNVCYAYCRDSDGNFACDSGFAIKATLVPTESNGFYWGFDYDYCWYSFYFLFEHSKTGFQYTLEIAKGNVLDFDIEFSSDKSVAYLYYNGNNQRTVTLGSGTSTQTFKVKSLYIEMNAGSVTTSYGAYTSVQTFNILLEEI